jgi:thiol-disulfide isomerase/thioredoxin
MTNETNTLSEEQLDEASEEMSADDIDGSFIPRPRPDVGGIELDGESILLVEGTDAPHWMNTTGTVVWNFLDGESSVDELSAELAKAFRADPEAVGSDVLDMVRALGKAGLLEGVAEEPFVIAPAMPEGLPLGSEISPFEAPDLDGRVRDFGDLRGKRVLLVNWSPTCGYCDRIAPELAELRPELDAHGVELVLVASGDAEANKEKAEPHGLGSAILLQSGQDLDLFQGAGTPSAYLLDEEGRTASELTVGADRVPSLALLALGRQPESAQDPPVPSDADLKSEG